jgi:hypothetical protein
MSEFHQLLNYFETKNNLKTLSTAISTPSHVSTPPPKPPRLKKMLTRSDSGTCLPSKFENNFSPYKQKYNIQEIHSRYELKTQKPNLQHVNVKALKQIWEKVQNQQGWKDTKFQIEKKQTLSTITHSHLAMPDYNHKYDAIACGVKTLTIKDIKMHHIELACQCCQSSFILTAVHECEKDKTLGKDKTLNYQLLNELGEQNEAVQLLL